MILTAKSGTQIHVSTCVCILFKSLKARSFSLLQRLNETISFTPLNSGLFYTIKGIPIKADSTTQYVKKGLKTSAFYDKKSAL